MSELLYREFTFERKAVDAKKRTVKIAFSSETPVDRGMFSEILGHENGEYDFSRLNNGAPLLLNHDPHSQIGVVEAARVESDGRRKVGRAVVRFGKGQLASEVFQDVQDGIRRNISVGYQTTDVVSRAKQGGSEAVRFRWAPYEITFAAIPADDTVGVGREIEITAERNFTTMTPKETQTEIIATSKMIEHDFPHLKDEIRRLNTEAILKGTPLESYQRDLLKLTQNNPAKSVITDDPGLGMSHEEIQKFSFNRAIRSASENGGCLRDCYEADVCQQAERTAKVSAEGFYIPVDIKLGMSRREFAQRDMNATTFSQGGGFIQTDVVVPVIEILRNRMVVARLGATLMSGLQGPIVIPRQTSTVTVSALPEIQALTDSNPSIDQIAMSAHRVGATSPVSKQLIIQSTPDAENFVRNDIFASVSEKHDSLALLGQGANSEPLGILNTPGVGSITFGGTATWDKVLAFESLLGAANADRGRMAFATTPLVKRAWKGTAVALAGATTVSATPLWGSGNFNDDSNDGVVNGYRSTSTNQIPNNQVLFGNWTDLIWGMWGGFDLVVDIYTLAKKAQVQITVNTWVDSALRHPQSFVCSADAGNQ